MIKNIHIINNFIYTTTASLDHVLSESLHYLLSTGIFITAMLRPVDLSILISEMSPFLVFRNVWRAYRNNLKYWDR